MDVTAAPLQNRSLRGLAEAALAIHSARSLEKMLSVIAEQARLVVGAHQAVISLTTDEGQPASALSLSEKYASYQGFAAMAGSNESRPLGQDELSAHPTWAGDQALPLRGWLAAPLAARDGQGLGLIGLSDKYQGDFDEADEATLAQLARHASLAIENARLSRAAKEREAHFRSLFASAPLGIVAVNEEGNIVMSNPALEALFGYRPGELDGKPLELLLPEHLRERHVRHRRVFARSPRSRPMGLGMDLLGRRQDGSTFPLEASLSWVSLAGETLAVAFITDIAKRKQAEDALRESEARFRTMADTAPMMIWMSGADKLCNYLNKRWLDFTGRTLAEELGNGWTQGLHPEDYARCLDTYVSAFDARREFEMEYRLKRADGEYRWILHRGTPRFLPDGTFIGYIGSGLDITERKAVEAELRDRAQQQAAVAALSWRALTSLDLDGLFDETVKLLSETLEVEYAKILELLPAGKELRLRSGVGWQEGLVGKATVSSGLESQAGYTLLAKEPIIVTDLRRETRFSGPPLLHNHGVVSGMSVVIGGREGPFGVLGIHTKDQRVFTQDDTNFLQSTANVLAAAIARRRAEETLRRRNREFQTLVERSPDIIARFDRKFRHLYINSVIEGITGLRPQDLLGKTNRELGMSEALTQYWQGELEKVFETAQERTLEFHYPTPDGVRYFHSRAVPEPNQQGFVESVLVMTRDVTELKRAEMERVQLLARERAARLEAEEASRRLSFLGEASTMLASSLGYEITLNNVGKLAVPHIADWYAIDLIKEGSVELVALAHIDPSKVAWGYELRRRYPVNLKVDYGIAKVVRTGLPEFYPEIPEEVLIAAARDDEHLRIIREIGFEAAMIVPLKVRERVIGTMTLVMAGSGRHYTPADLELAQELARRAAVAVDNARLFSEAQQLNEDLESRVQQRTSQLEEAYRELESFSYSVSHDLRTPLRGIDGFSQALLEDYGEVLDDTAKHYLGRVRAGTQRMGQLIDDLLKLSRISRKELHYETIDLSALAQAIIDELRRKQPDRQVAFSCAEGMTAEGDARLLAIALENLLDNAWKFTAGREQASITFSASRHDDTLVYRIEDNGAGFDMRYADKLFGAFQRLHSEAEFKGTGIGLATVKRIIARHGGRVWAEAEPGRGASFFFTLGEGDGFGD